MVSYPPVAHIGADVAALIVHSVVLERPMVVVTFNYRLNIFGFGNGKEKNLALKDQKLAIDWVVKHIGGFGGDKVLSSICHSQIYELIRSNRTISLSRERAQELYMLMLISV